MRRLAIVLCLLTACTGTGTRAPVTTTTTSTPSLGWTGCSGHSGWQCASLAVPLDHAHPGPTIRIALTRHQAGAHRVGSLLVNPGGPGASGVQFAYDMQGAGIFGQLFDHFDIVGFDPRGVGASTPIRCTDGPTLDRLGHLDPAPTTPAGLTALEAGAQELARDCAAHAGALLAHVSTVDAAEDMDDIRAALGDKGLSYLGFSYGTLLGATYAHLFPTHVRALALDSALDPAIDEATMSITQAVGFEQNLDAFFTWCAQGNCPLRRAAFDTLMARIKVHPIAVGGRSLGPGEAFLGVANPLYSPATWPDLATALEDAERGDGATLLAFYDEYVGRHRDGTYDNIEESNTAINCLDRPTPPSVTAFATLAAQAAKQAPFFGAADVWGDLPCLYWPVRPVGKVGPITAPGAPPILVVGSTGDPATPYAWAQHLASELGSGVLLTRSGEGHGAYLASACIRTIVDSYLISLNVPAPGTRCT